MRIFSCILVASYGRLDTIRYIISLSETHFSNKNNRQQGLDTMSERIKLSVLSALLLLALVFSAFTIANTYQAVRNLQLRNHDVKAGNVSTIRAWMTVPAISRIYHVPEDYVYRSLEISSPASYHQVTLYEIANRKHQPVDQVIHTLQHAILNYRKQHLVITKPSRMSHSSKKRLAPVLGRAKL
jgi:hypothetical protein